MKRPLAAIVLALCAVAASADDVLVLTNGREARGRIVEVTDAGVKLEVGGGKMFYPKAQISEVRRGVVDGVARPGPDDDVKPDATREECSLLYDDGRRVGTRTFRASKLPGGFRFEEAVVFLDKKDAPEMEVRTTERCDENFLPVAFSVRESAGEKSHRMVSGEVRGGRLYLTILRDGDKSSEDAALPPEARFPFAARELFLRETKALAGRLDIQVFDTRDLRFRPMRYEEGGRRAVAADGATDDLRVIVRRRGDVTEHEWVDDALASRMSELNGEALRALAVTADVVARVRRGDTERVTGPDSAARTRYADAERGFRIAKPDPSWTFEAPLVKGAGALVSVKNVPLFASVDVLVDTAAAPGTTVEHASEALQRLLRAVAPDFRVVADGFTGTGPTRVYWLEAEATTKGEKTRTLARVLVRRDKVWRLLAACPESAFATLRPELEKVLDSFAVD